MDGDPARLIDPAAVARFAGDWSRLQAGGDRFGLAVSGGPDSLALLLLAQAALPGRIEAATCDHGLRREAAGEAAMVATVCARLGVPHRTLPLGLAPGAGVQARARQARYAALAGWLAERGLGALATAHHADDQAELLVMRLNRGAGLRGLAGMHPRAALPGAPGLVLLRPLLDWRRAELAALVATAGYTPADDPSNRDSRYERVRVRQGLAAAEWLDPAALAGSAEHLAQADAALDWAADLDWAHVTQGPHWTYASEAPRAVKLRVLARIVAELGGSEPRGSAVARWLDGLEAGAVATLGGVRGDGRGVLWRFEEAAAHRSSEEG